VLAAINGADAGRAVATSLGDPSLQHLFSHPLHVVAAGKAAETMVAAITAEPRLTLKTVVAAGTHRGRRLSPDVEWHDASHPLPDMRSVAAGHRARAVATTVTESEGLVLLLSGGASALLAAPADGISLEDKRLTIERMMHAGADIHGLNAVRKHLSSIKGGHLAAVCRGRTTTLAVSDVIDDDLSVIGSGPGVPDPSSWDDAATALERFGGNRHQPRVVARIAAGRHGDIPDTPKPGASALARASGQVIASRADALSSASREAETRGYRVVVLEDAVKGEARIAAQQWYQTVQHLTAAATAPTCVLSAGETTVRVSGTGRGGRNQEFALALVESLARSARTAVLASAGSDGIDGPTDAAGAIVDWTTAARASERGFAPHRFLDENDSFRFFAALGDLIRTGPTDTNVGDLQVYLRT
jgi:glycerate 2-kinase